MVETPFETEPLPACDCCGRRATRELVPGLYACSAACERRIVDAYICERCSRYLPLEGHAAGCYEVARG